MTFGKPDFSLNKKNLFKLAMIAVLFGYSALVFSAAPSGGYDPFETLDPDCLPGETDCIAQVVNTSAQWTQDGLDIYYNSGSIGTATTESGALFDVRTGVTFSESFDSTSTGLNDIIIDVVNYSGNDNTFTVTMGSWDGNTDTFSWSDLNGDCIGETGVAITGSPQELCNNFFISFENWSGHSQGTSWEIEVGSEIIVPASTEFLGQSFSGSGTDDGIFSGTYTGTEPYVEFYAYVDSFISNGFGITIDSEGTPDTFSWYDYNNECAGDSGVAITVGVPQELCNGISVTFGADTGHLVGDQWDYYFDSTVLPRESVTYTNPVSNQDDAVFSGTYNYTETFYFEDSSAVCAPVSGIVLSADVPYEFCSGLSFTIGSGEHVSGDVWTGSYQYNDEVVGGVVQSQTDSIADPLDDASFSGNYTGISEATYVITLSNTQTVRNEFDWSATGCAGETGVDIYAGVPYLLCNGIYVTFGSSIGHTEGTEWTYIISNETTNTFGINESFIINDAGDIVKINNINYSWPLSSGGGGSINNDGDGTLVWSTNSGIPYQFGNSGRFLTTDGSTVSWGAITVSAWIKKNTAAEPSIFLGGDNGYNVNRTGSLLIGQRVANSPVYNNISAFGYNSGYGSNNTQNSVLVGYNTAAGVGSGANAVMLGMGAGTSGQAPANQVPNSVFIGGATGDAPSGGTGLAHSSIFIGYQAGLNDTANNSGGTTSILIGKLANTGGFERSIALGTSATNTASNQFMIGSTTSPIDTTRINGSASTQCTITTGTGIACSSDERLKTNITDLDTDTLTKLLNVRTVTYNWLQDPDTPTQIGFIAQDLEQQFPELVITDDTGYKSVYYAQMTPILVESIREMNLKITALESLTPETSPLFATIRTWLADAGNGIVEVVVKITRSKELHTNESYTDQLCIGTTCVNEQQLQQIVQG